jgi:hypothetical protein
VRGRARRGPITASALLDAGHEHWSPSSGWPLLGKIPYKDVARPKVTLPKRQKRGDYREPDYPYKFVPERF